MHFHTLAVVDIPEMAGNEAANKPAENAALSSIEPPQRTNDMHNSTLDSFTCEVIACVVELMEPYYVATEDPRYLEFFDRTEEMKVNYVRKIDCLKLPDGKIVEHDKFPWCSEYAIRNGKVYQKMAGSLQHEKRTRKAKRIKALPGYPREKMYKGFEDFAEKYYGISFDEEHHAYGEYFNPHGRFDWYEIGGRWSWTFLVKDTCEEYFWGGNIRQNQNGQLDAPEGYRWANAARKKDIEWQVMRDWIKIKLTEQFYQLEKMFYAGKLEKDIYGKITEEGILSGDRYLYRADESLNAYLERMDVPESWKYPFAVHTIVDAEQLISKDDDFSEEDQTKQTNSADWHSSLDQYIDGLGDDAVLVSVDYHI